MRAEEAGERDAEDPEKWARRPADPKSIANRHGLLYCIVQAAIDSEPQLRTTNCCKRTKLPRVDDHTAEEMTFLGRDEYQRIAAKITDPDARDLADWLVGTGMRWSEATALKVHDLSLAGERPSVSIQRAWKKAKKGTAGGAFYLGSPKTRKARRLPRLSPAQVEMARRLVAGLGPDDHVFRAAKGGAWRHANFYNRKWLPAVKAAVAKGLPKKPRLHDLRHTHVSWLIAARIPLPAIQIRLGHESIQTTVDRYGHLVQGLGSPRPRTGGSANSAGIRVDQDTALQYSPFFAGVRVLSEDLGALPLFLYERLQPRGKQRATDHPLYSLLHDQPNEMMGAAWLKETLQRPARRGKRPASKRSSG